MKVFKFIIFLILLSACGLRTIKLPDGGQRAAINPKVYSNKSKFDKSLLTIIDTLVIYEQYNTSYYIGDNQVNGLARLNYQNPNTFYGVCRFYSNGCFNYFILNRKDSLLSEKMFDPNDRGWRGVYYKLKDRIKGDLITQISGMGEIGILKESYKFNGDTLFVSIKNMENIYLKRRIPIGLLKNQADW